EVPGCDRATAPQRRIVDAAAHGSIARVDHAPGLLAGQFAVVVETGGDIVHVHPGLDDPLAGVIGLGASELLLALAQLLGHPQQQIATLRSGHTGPHAVIERTPGSGDRAYR